MLNSASPSKKLNPKALVKSPRKHSEITSDRLKLDSYTQQLIERGKVSSANIQKYL